MISNSTTVSANNNSVINTNKNKQNQRPNFKGIGSSLVNIPGQTMNGIENGGFLLSFLIQDTLGMTVPRTREGLYRDRDKKNTKFKDMNFKEAGEVFIREFLSGPLMMFTPMAVFALSKKALGKSSFTNTGLLKKMGNNFTEIIKNKKAGDTVKGIKKNFYRNTIKEMVESTTPEATGKTDKIIDKIYGHVEKLDVLEAQKKTAKGKSFTDTLLNIFKSSDKKVKSEKDIIKEEIKMAKNGIVDELNNFHKSNSSNLELVNKAKLGSEVHSSEDTITAMRSYAFDAIKGDDATKLTEETSKKISRNSMIKRVFATVAASFATIGSTSIVPKLYSILNPVPPGALDNECMNPEHNHAPKSAQTTTNNAQKNNDAKKGAVPFKGNILKHLQFDGNQLTPVLMMTLAAGGLIAPRVNTAVKRAPVDENGKKNLIEVPEILTRDIVSTGAVTFGVPLLTKAMVNSYEDKSGFVLTNKPKTKESTFKKLLDVINPFSNVSPYSNKDIKEIYGNINNKEKLTHFAEFIDQNNGSLAKVFKPLINGKSSFAGSEADFDAISKLDRKASNSKIIKVIAEKFDDKAVEKLMKPAKTGKAGAANEMLLRARTLNSVPRFLNTLILVPVFLGVILPKIVYGITAKNRKKLEMAQQAKQQTQTTMTNNTAKPINTVKISPNKTGIAFEQLKHNNK